MKSMKSLTRATVAYRPRNALILLLAFVVTSATPGHADATTCLTSALYLVRPTITVVEGPGDPEAELERWPREEVHLGSRHPIGFDLRSPAVFFRFEAAP